MVNLVCLWDNEVRVLCEAAGEVGLNSPKTGARKWRLPLILFHLMAIESDPLPKLGNKVGNVLSTVLFTE